MREFITRFNKEEIGFDVAVVSDIPFEHGMGWTSSVGAAMSLFLEHALMVVQSPEERSSLCVSAERQFVPSSVDRVGAFTASCSQRDSLLFVNCHTSEGEWMPLDPSICLLVCKCGDSLDGNDIVVNTNATATNATATNATTTNATTTTILTTLQSSYSQLTSLSDATPDQVEAMRKELGSTYPLAYHLVSEVQRVQSCKEAMEAKDYDRVGSLLIESHASLRDNTSVTSPNVDSLVEIAIEQTGVLGARFTGDDCVACLVESSQAKGVMKAIEADYKERTGVSCSVFVCNPSQGAYLLQEEGAVEKRLWQRPLLWVGVASVAAAAMMVVLRSRRSCCVCLQTYSNSLMSMLAIPFYNPHIIHPIHSSPHPSQTPLPTNTHQSSNIETDRFGNNATNSTRKSRLFLATIFSFSYMLSIASSLTTSPASLCRSGITMLFRS